MGARKITLRLMALAAALTLPATAMASCPNHFMAVGEVWGDKVRLRYKFEPETPDVSERFVMDIAICSDNQPFLGPLKVDADMPEHGHGLNYRPRVSAVAAGAYKAEGLLLHMRGDWRFKFVLNTKQGPLRLESRYRLK